MIVADVPQVIFETERLRARHLDHGDLDALVEVYGDAEAMRWVGDGRPSAEYGATIKGLHRIIATMAPENAASQKVLVKTGMVSSELRSNENGSSTRVFVWHHAESPLPSPIQGNDARRN